MDEISDVFIHVRLKDLSMNWFVWGKILCAKEESVRISRQLHAQETRESVNVLKIYLDIDIVGLSFLLQFVLFETNLLYHLPDYLEAFAFSVDTK
jgi:hypothetical protein